MDRRGRRVVGVVRADDVAHPAGANTVDPIRIDRARSDKARSGRGPRPQRKRWRRVLPTVTATLAVLTGLALTAGGVLAYRFDQSIQRGNLLGHARTDTRGADTTGPLNFLLIGSNWRDEAPSNGERADTIMIVHVSRDLKHAFLVSVPRDLYYTIKPYPPTGYRGSTEKIDAALNYGGMPLMAQTIADLTGLRFDGAVEAQFAGFQKAVEALGGVDMCIDEETVSVHIGWDRNGKYAHPYTNTASHPIPVPGVTPKVYKPGCQHLQPWEALDFVRQRELLPDGDYARQRHQQQLLTAVLKQTASAGTLSDPVKLDRTLRAIGQALTIDTNGASLTDFIYALRGITSDTLVGLKTPSHPTTIAGTSYVIGEPDMPDLWKATRDDDLTAYATTHPQLVNPLHPGATPAPPSPPQ